MPFELLQYETSGRTFIHSSDPNRRVFKSSIGEQNIYDESDGKYKPYIFNPTSKNLRFGKSDCEIDYSDDGFEVLKVAGSTIASNSKFFVQRYVNGDWQNEPHGAPTKSIQHGYPQDNFCTLYLDFPDAQYDLQIGFEAGPRRTAKLGFRFRSPINAVVRFQWVLEGLNKMSGQGYEWIWQNGGHPNYYDGPRKVGIRFKDVEFKWTYREAIDRDAVITNLAGKKKLVINEGPYDVTANEWLYVYPETWTPSPNVPTEEGIDQGDTNSLDQGLWNSWMVEGYYGGNTMEIGWRWASVNIPSGATLSTGTPGTDGCYITLATMDSGDSGGGASDCFISCATISGTGPATIDGDALPSSRTYYATTQAFNVVAQAGVVNSPDIAVVVQQAIDDADWDANDSLLLWWQTNLSASSACWYETQFDTRISLEYTTGGGENATVEPTAITMSLAQIAPTYAIDTTQTPTADILSLNQPAPSLGIDSTLLPAADSLSLNQPALSIAIGGSFDATADILSLNQLAAALEIDTNVVVSSEVLTLNQPAATVAADTNIAAVADALTLNQPAASLSIGPVVIVASQELSLNQPSPTLSIDTDVTTTVQTLSLNQNAATLEISSTFAATVETLVLTQNASVVVTGALILAGVQALTLAQPAPTVSTISTFEATAESLALNQPAPQVFTGTVISPVVQALSLAQPTPAVIIDSSVSVALQTLSLVQNAPTIIAGAIILPAVQSLTLTQPAPAITVDASVAAASQALSLNQPAPTVSTGTIISASVETLALIQNAPIIITGTIVSPTVQALILSQPTPAFVIDSSVNAASQALVLNQPAPVVTTGLVISQTTITLALSQPAPTISIDALVSAGSSVQLSIAQVQPTINYSGSITISVQSLSLTQQAPALLNEKTVAAALQSMSLTQLSPAVEYNGVYVVSVAPALGLAQGTPILLIDSETIVLATFVGTGLETYGFTGATESFGKVASSESYNITNS